MTDPYEAERKAVIDSLLWLMDKMARDKLLPQVIQQDVGLMLAKIMHQLPKIVYEMSKLKPEVKQ